LGAPLPMGPVTRVEIVTIALDDSLPGDRSLLAPDEIARADRFRHDRDRGRYTTGRARLRGLLGARCGTLPADLEFAYGPQGKPRVAGHPGLSFNLSHADDLAVLAVTNGTVIGVDVEPEQPGIARSGMAEQFFAPAEVTHLWSLPPAVRDRAFLECWTRKEAYLKAKGGGLSLALDGFEVAFGPDRPARLVRADADPSDCSGWTMVDLAGCVPNGFIAALAVGQSANGVTLTRIDEEQRGT